MAERSLRGSRLGALSMERDEHVVPSQRQITTYRCPNGHVIELPFSIEAEIPPSQPAPTGTCCSSGAPSPSSRNSSRSGLRCFASRAAKRSPARAPEPRAPEMPWARLH